MWIDRSKAVVVSLEHGNVATRTIQSGAGRKPRSKGGARMVAPYGPQAPTKEAALERRFEQHLGEYYDQVVSAASGADAVFIMGPGEARQEFQKRLEGAGTVPRSVENVPSDKLTEAQILEKVKLHYGYPTRESF